ncbi:MAG: transposase [Euryarchaeota archaeon]|nr:transposase [Euryarchaeota archaeon]
MGRLYKVLEITRGCGIGKLTRAVILESYPLTERKFKAIAKLFNEYREILEELVFIALENEIESHVRLRNLVYKDMKERYKGLPTHYIYTACQDAVTRVKSFLRLKRKGIARTERPEIRSVSIWLDDVLWDFKSFPRLKERKDGQKTLFIRISTKHGRITIPLRPHKLFFKYLNNKWKVRANVKLRIDFEKRVVYAIFTFQKKVKERRKPEGYIAVDYNLNNVAFGDYERICIVKTNVGFITEKYTNIMRGVQKKHLVGWKVKRPSKKGKKLLKKFGRRRANRIKDTLQKLARRIVETACMLNAAIVVEDLGRFFNQRVARRTRSKRQRNKLHNISAKRFLFYLEEKAKEYGIPVIKVDPAYSSSLCPYCGSLLDEDAMRPRVKICHKCGFKANRDVIAVLNLLNRAGPPPSGPKANESPVKGLVAPMTLDLEANLLHHRNTLFALVSAKSS